MIVSRAELLITLGTDEDSISSADSALLNLVHPLAEASLAAFMQADLSCGQRVEYLPIGQSTEERNDLEDIRKQGDRVIFASGRVGHEALQLRHTPVLLAGLEVREDQGSNAGQASGAFAVDTTLTLGSDYWLDVASQTSATDPATAYSTSGLLYRYGSWPTGPRTVRVTYLGGFSAAQLNGNIAGAIKLSALETILTSYKTLKGAQGASIGGKVSESIGKYSYTNSQTASVLTSMAIAIPFSARERLQPFRTYSY